MDVASRSSLCNANWEHGARACRLLSLAFLGLAWLRLVVVCHAFSPRCIAGIVCGQHDRCLRSSFSSPLSTWKWVRDLGVPPCHNRHNRGRGDPRTEHQGLGPVVFTAGDCFSSMSAPFRRHTYTSSSKVQLNCNNDGVMCLLACCLLACLVLF